jgi:predicted aspartyl protease
LAWLGVLFQAAASAQVPAAGPGITSYEVDLHFFPAAERKPAPIEIVNGIILFKAQVGGKDVWATLDNRSVDSLIDLAFARSNGMKLGPPIGDLRTPTGALKRRRVQDADITIPGQVRFRAPLSAVDLSFPSKMAGRPISLVLGREYFENLGFLIDPRDGQLKLGPSGALRVPPTIPSVVLKNDRPQVDITIDGKPAVVTVDFGYNGFVALNQAAWDRLKLDQSPTIQKETAHAEGEVHYVKSTIADKVTMGPAAVSKADVRLEDGFPEDGDGIVGMSFLSKFIFSIDEKSRRLWFISGV